MDYLKRFARDRYNKYTLEQDMVSDEMSEFLSRNGFTYYDIEVFVCPANWKMPVHCDDAYFGNYAKINFIYSEDPNHTMDWYEPKDNWVESERKIYTNYGNAQGNENPAHYWFNDDEVSHVYSESFTVAQINAGLPHSITTGNTSRTCVSFIPFFANGDYMTMDYVLQTS